MTSCERERADAQEPAAMRERLSEIRRKHPKATLAALPLPEGSDGQIPIGDGSAIVTVQNSMARLREAVARAQKS